MFRRRSAGVQQDPSRVPTDRADAAGPDENMSGGRGPATLARAVLGRARIGAGGGGRIGDDAAAGATERGVDGRRAGRGDAGAANRRGPERRRPAESGKGRPTPKRREAERRRRRSITGGTDARQQRARTRAERARVYEARKRGEEWALQPRDRGPVKALARDYVDSRRRLSEYYMWILLLLVVALFARVTVIEQFSEVIVIALIVAVVIEGLVMRRGLRRLIAQRLPGESTRGVTMYAVMRALQMRRLRIPAPRVRPGDKI